MSASICVSIMRTIPLYISLSLFLPPSLSPSLSLALHLSISPSITLPLPQYSPYSPSLLHSSSPHAVNTSSLSPSPLSFSHSFPLPPSFSPSTSLPHLTLFIFFIHAVPLDLFRSLMGNFLRITS